jgi:hypothetical protein
MKEAYKLVLFRAGKDSALATSAGSDEWIVQRHRG